MKRSSSMNVDKSPENEKPPPAPIPHIQTQGSEKELDAVRKYKSTLRSVCVFIIFNEFCERLAFYGFSGSLNLFLTREMGYTSEKADAAVNVWVAFTYATPLIGGWIADSYLGRYLCIIVFSIIYLLGMITTSLMALPDLRNEALFFVALCIVALGAGGIKPNVSTFGADQFNDADPIDVVEKQSFFNYFYFSINLGAFISFSIIAYICQNVSFSIGYMIPSIAMAFSLLLFFVGRNRYVKRPPEGSVLARFLGSLWHALWGDRSHPVNHWLDRAKTYHGGRYSEDEVEDAKAVLGLFPYLFFFVIYWGVYSQMNTTFINQGCVMNLGVLNIPIAALNLFDALIIVVCIPLFDRFLYPALKRCGLELTMLRKIGAGFFVAGIAMIVAGIIESQRLSLFHSNHLAGHTICAAAGQEGPMVVDFSILWQIPQYLLVGVSEVLAAVTAYEFFYTQAPQTMKSVCTALYLLTTSFGSFVGAALLPIVNSSDKKWLPPDINDGHLDFYFFTLAGLMGLNLILFIIAARSYQYVSDRRVESYEQVRLNDDREISQSQ